MDIRKDIFERRNDVVARSVAGELLLVPVMGSLADMRRIFSLNEVGEFIWNDLDGRKSVSDIIEDVLGVFDAAPEAAESDVIEFISELRSNGLVVASGDDGDEACRE